MYYLALAYVSPWIVLDTGAFDNSGIPSNVSDFTTLESVSLARQFGAEPYLLKFAGM